VGGGGWGDYDLKGLVSDGRNNGCTCIETRSRTVFVRGKHTDGDYDVSHYRERTPKRASRVSNPCHCVTGVTKRRNLGKESLGTIRASKSQHLLLPRPRPAGAAAAAGEAADGERPQGHGTYGGGDSQQSLRPWVGGGGALGSSELSTAGGGAVAKCALCAREFKSKHAVRIHLMRNVKCRREVRKWVMQPSCWLVSILRRLSPRAAISCLRRTEDAQPAPAWSNLEMSRCAARGYDLVEI